MADAFPSPARWRHLRWLMPATVLLVAVMLQAWTVIFHPLSRSLPPQLANVIPAELPGWQTKELPLAEIEETRNSVISTLKFDQFVSRMYRRGSVIVTIYVAYWQPDKVPPRSVGVHTPDTCWVQNGWKRTSRTHAVPLTVPGGGTLKPAEFGTYTMSGVTQEVYFWHLVGGRPYSYEQEGLHSLIAPLKDMATFGLRQKRDQLFVRLACNVPFTQVWNDPGFDLLLQALARLDLASVSVEQQR